MTTRNRAGVLGGALLVTVALLTGCTGGSESNAAEETKPAREIEGAAQQVQQVNARKQLESISPEIPVYQGAQFRDDLTQRDRVMIRSRYGTGAEVYTLATDDSFPQVYHYYTTYLAQFRAFPAQDTYPSERKNWRTLEVKLNEAMQDSFIPGRELDLEGKQVTLQVAETEAEPRTVIRYIVTPAAPAAQPPVATASNEAAEPAVTR